MTMPTGKVFSCVTLNNIRFNYAAELQFDINNTENHTLQQIKQFMLQLKFHQIYNRHVWDPKKCII